MLIPNFRLGPIDLVMALPYVCLLIVVVAVLLAVPGLTWLERVVLGLIHDRLGPNRVGPRGLLQPIADGVKLFFKEDILPAAASKPIYFIAPALAMIPPLAAMAVIPFGDVRIDLGNGNTRSVALVAADVNIGVLWVIGLASLQAYGLILGGWSGNNKYSLLGALRASAQSISYELAMSLSVMTAVLMAGSLSMLAIVESQRGTVLQWNILRLFPFGALAALVFAVAAVAETNRAPFDLPEAESELVAGYQTEYSSMKFAVYFMSEYAALIVGCALATTLWLGGWLPPHPAVGFVPGPVWFVGKIAVLIVTAVWVRATLPRFRYDALMRFGWQRLFPFALAALAGAAVVDAVRTDPLKPSSIPPRPAKPGPQPAGVMGVPR